MKRKFLIAARLTGQTLHPSGKYKKVWKIAGPGMGCIIAFSNT